MALRATIIATWGGTGPKRTAVSSSSSPTMSPPPPLNQATENSRNLAGETLPNFQQKSNLKKNFETYKGILVKCARHLSGVGYAQGLAQIPK
ncbi:hypothetical protein ACE6H2_016598 [Prunus campanulata]